MRIVFMGTPEFAVPSLESLLRSDDSVVGVVTQPDRPKGRGETLTAPPVKLICLREKLSLLQPAKMKEPAFLDALRSWQPDLIVVTAFGRILTPAILAIPPHGCVNVHASLLPKYRGAGPIQWAIIRGERETGITTMQMDKGMDTGPILLQRPLPIAPDDTAGTLSVKLAEMGGRLLIETVQGLKDGTLRPRLQDHAQATMAPLLNKEDGLIEWTLPADAIANRIRGMSPWPGAFTHAQDERLTIWKASALDQQTASATPGTILDARKDAILVASGSGVLAVMELQPANSRRMTVAQYLAGHPMPAGLILGAGPPAPPAS